MSDPRLAQLLKHPALWRGRSAARCSVVPTGFAALDASLPGNGWPQIGLVEILTPHLGVGELYLILPALAFLTRESAARWCAWVAPPFEPFAPALAAHGVRLSRMLVVRADRGEPAGQAGRPLWACEQALRSGACGAVLAWLPPVSLRALRRLQLATERGRTLAFLFRTLSRATMQEPTHAVLRVAVEPNTPGARVRLLRSRGGSREAVDLEFGPVARV
jgi:protein ImuA